MGGPVASLTEVYSFTWTLSFLNTLTAPLTSAGESSVIVSLYLVILLPQLWLTEPFQAACKSDNATD